MKKQYQNQIIGKCPKCNSEYIDYDGNNYECYNFWYNVKCSNCGLKFKEVYELKFLENNSK